MKTPWLPKKPAKQPVRKCPRCKGKGIVKMWVAPWKDEDRPCTDCGGKGWL